MADFGISSTAIPIPIPNAVNSTSLGRRRSVPNGDGTFQQQVCLYVPAALQGVIASGMVCFVGHATTLGQYYQAQDSSVLPASGSSVLPVVLAEAVLVQHTLPATGSYAWFTYSGKCKALVDGTTAVVLGDQLLCKSGTVDLALIRDSTVRGPYTVGQALVAQGTAGAQLVDVLLYGDNCVMR